MLVFHLGSVLEKTSKTQRERLLDAVEQSMGSVDQRFLELMEQLDKWSEETLGIMRSQTNQAHSALWHLDLKAIRKFRTVFGKWSIEIVAILVARGGVRFEELRRTLKGISSRVLSRKLRAMEETGFVKRTILESRPPSALYELSERGIALARIGRPVVLFLLAEAAKEAGLR